jgi:hypothetical protein
MMTSLEQQIRQLADAVDDQLVGHAEAPEPARSAGRRSMLVIAAAVTVLVGVGALVGLGVVRDADQGTDSALTPREVAEIRAGLDAQLPDVTESQQRALEDGVVTVTEILDLAQEADDCSASAGGPDISFEWDGDGVSWSVTTGRGDEAEHDRLVGIADTCWERHVGLASMYVGLQAVLPADDQRRVQQLTVDCLADAGIDAPDWPATNVDIDPSVEATCDDQAKQLLDLER